MSILPISRSLIQTLGFDEEIKRVKELFAEWIQRSDSEIKQFLNWQLLGSSKYFRPVTIFACYQAVRTRSVNSSVIHSAAALELLHNVSLIIDDILDRSRHRRGKVTLHCRFGVLPALMTAGYMTVSGFEMVSDEAHTVRLLAELIKRLGVAECLQWRLRRHPLGVEAWRKIAEEDTGTMFEICACLGSRGEALRTYGRLLGTLYHGCDDVGDVRGAATLGGGGNEDLRDGILTLPVAVAIRDPKAAIRFRNNSPKHHSYLVKKMAAALPGAERYLDQIAQEAIEEAARSARNSDPLIALVQHTRQLSRA